MGRGIAYLQGQCNKDLLRIQKAVSSIPITSLLPEFTQTVGYSKGFLYSTLCTQQVLCKVSLLLLWIGGRAQGSFRREVVLSVGDCQACQVKSHH